MRLPVIDSPTPSRPAGFESGPRSINAVKVLRISVTDRCNYRCVYCMPEDGVAWLPKEQILSFEEIADVVKAAIEVHGIRRFKLTGGEPTVRHGLLDLVAMLRRIPGIEDLSLTTNGQRLLELASPLKEAGLDRVTVSLDSLRADRFNRITRTGDLHAVLAGIDRCVDVGFGSLKINCVTMRGTNDDELADFAAMTIVRPITVRFIEYMPLGDAAVMHENAERRTLNAELNSSSSFSVQRSAFSVAASETGPAGGCGAQDRGDVFVSEAEVRAAIDAVHGGLVPVDRDSEAGVGPAKVFQLVNARGRVGFISAMSAPFCDTCNRLRLTADGLLRSCLFEGGEVDVRPILRGGVGDRYRALADAMSECVRLKPDVHSGHGSKQMSRIGG